MWLKHAQHGCIARLACSKAEKMHLMHCSLACCHFLNYICAFCKCTRLFPHHFQRVSFFRFLYPGEDTSNRKPSCDFYLVSDCRPRALPFPRCFGSRTTSLSRFGAATWASSTTAPSSGSPPSGTPTSGPTTPASPGTAKDASNTSTSWWKQVSC